MQWNRAHQGNVRQKLYAAEVEQAEQQARSRKADDEGAAPLVGVEPRLHVPEITMPEEEESRVVSDTRAAPETAPEPRAEKAPDPRAPKK